MPRYGTLRRTMVVVGALHKALKIIIYSRFQRVTPYWLTGEQHFAAGFARSTRKGILHCERR